MKLESTDRQHGLAENFKVNLELFYFPRLLIYFWTTYEDNISQEAIGKRWSFNLQIEDSL